jgi:hypothetical protein
MKVLVIIRSGRSETTVIDPLFGAHDRSFLSTGELR